MARRQRLREWFRDDGSWQVPDGRRGEFVALLVGLPLYASIVHFDAGLPAPREYWPAVVLGACGGFWYVAYYREGLADQLPDWAGVEQVLSFVIGGVGLSLLRLIDLGNPTVCFLLTACGTVLSIYLVRLVSPFHRGVEPPTAVGESRIGTDR
ncbi:hypothetical protein A6E15_11585 [Natrinema saccharevitans]|uniref:Uncharacterized protein n=1 Tax=Natrinema saccharevitans TaxID=301967 RepID=A0A1S8AYZ7_9EURY|nr:hypothetical protein [Natrinema saccharevitans]OLZ41584.1 hypothetical protein A6E15_11585 [Natrinema saccharevitans]